MAKKKWAVSVTWVMCGTDYVYADTAEEAMQIAENPSRPLPSDRSFIEDSYVIEGVQEEKGDNNEGCC